MWRPLVVENGVEEIEAGCVLPLRKTSLNIPMTNLPSFPEKARKTPPGEVYQLRGGGGEAGGGGVVIPDVFRIFQHFRKKFILKK